MGRIGAAAVAVWFAFYGGNTIWNWGLTPKFLAVVILVAAVIIVLELIFAPVEQTRRSFTARRSAANPPPN